MNAINSEFTVVKSIVKRSNFFFSQSNPKNSLAQTSYSKLFDNKAYKLQ